MLYDQTKRKSCAIRSGFDHIFLNFPQRVTRLVEPQQQFTRAAIERAFTDLRAGLGIRADFPDEALREAECVARERDPAASLTHADRTDVPFVTVDPPGSRDLDQAVHAERAGDGYRVRYAIADVGFWVDRGGRVEAEAWLRGATFYAPDRRTPLYPPALGEGAASLLPDRVRPAVLFDLELDGRAELRRWTVGRALVRSRAQLTYAQLLEHVRQGGTSPLTDEPWADTLALLGEIGPLRLRLEGERGGVSLPIRDQHVQRQAALALGYEVRYEEPSPAEGWNAQISLLTGHAAATRMLEAGVGILRTMPPFDAAPVRRFRRIALALGFVWPEETSYAVFLHGVDPAHPHAAALVRQARRVMRGADYHFFRGMAPEQPFHAALAFAYAHVTAPLRRLADRYVLDLLVDLAAGAEPSAAELTTLERLPPVMNQADRKEAQLERRVVDTAEAWTLRDRVGQRFAATVIDARPKEIEVQIEEPPTRALVAWPGPAPAPVLGSVVRLHLAGVDVAAGSVRFESVEGPP